MDVELHEAALVDDHGLAVLGPVTADVQKAELPTSEEGAVLVSSGHPLEQL